MYIEDLINGFIEMPTPEVLKVLLPREVFPVELIQEVEIASIHTDGREVRDDLAHPLATDWPYVGVEPGDVELLRATLEWMAQILPLQTRHPQRLLTR